MDQGAQDRSRRIDVLFGDLHERLTLMIDRSAHSRMLRVFDSLVHWNIEKPLYLRSMQVHRLSLHHQPRPSTCLIRRTIT